MCADCDVTGPVKSPAESVGPKPSYHVHLLVAIWLLTYVRAKDWNCAEQYLLNGSSCHDVSVELSNESESVSLSSLFHSLNEGIAVAPSTLDKTRSGDRTSRMEGSSDEGARARSC